MYNIVEKYENRIRILIFFQNLLSYAICIIKQILSEFIFNFFSQ